MARTAVLGFPRIGRDRELKRALEAYWRGDLSAADLQRTARELRDAQRGRARAAGVDVLPVGDFALYDHVLDVAELVGIVSERHGGSCPAPPSAVASPASGGEALDRHFLACRGGRTADGRDVTPLEMTKWFDTNYHYLVPELRAEQPFRLAADKWLGQVEEARDVRGATVRPVVLGPLSLLLAAKAPDGADPLDRLDELAEVYGELLDRLGAAGVAEVQFDEPALVLDRDDRELDAFARAYRALTAGEGRPTIALATYFERLDGGALRRIAALPLGELHVDLVRAPDQLDAVLDALPAGARLSAGVVDGRNVWATDVDRALDLLDRAAARIGSDRLTIAPSCSLLHVPYSARRETTLDDELRSWLAFGDEKLDELALLARALDADPATRDELLADARARTRSRAASPRTNAPAVRERVAGLRAEHYDRPAPVAERLALQRDRLGLPLLPTTTIGSFPQTADIREQRRRHRAGDLDAAAYECFLEEQIDEVVRRQEELGLDVLVHGEPERNDMVEYFGEQLDGFAFSDAGWVQSYGSRCVKPPILYGDVSRPAPMTVRWWRYAQGRTAKPMKGMLTGPVTILQWSFVRDDQPRRETATQIALAIQDEVVDLEAAGAAIVQVDEAALREGLPLRRADQDDYVRWAVDAFRLTAARARPETQIHTHMCYSEFNEMIEHIARLDADVLSIEASRSGMELLEVFERFDYRAEIGPGVYDIHSPRVPSVDEMEALLRNAERHLRVEGLWVNPDCGLKTRGWAETTTALEHLVEAARRRRAAVADRVPA